MSTSILYHGFGVRHYRHLRTEFIGGSVVFHIEKSPDKQRCADCRSRDIILKGRIRRKLRTLPIGGKKVFTFTGCSAGPAGRLNLNRFSSATRDGAGPGHLAVMFWVFCRA